MYCENVRRGLPSWSILLCLPACGVGIQAVPADVTVEIGDRVLVPDTMRFGLNLGGDAYYSGAALVKKRVTANFEGTMYRQCHFGPVQDERGCTTWFRDWGSWDDILVGARFTILSGPAKGTSGTIIEVAKKTVQHQGQPKEFRYFVFDRQVPAGGPNVGILVEAPRLRDGQFRSLDGFWSSKANGIAIGDVPPGSFGHAAAVLDGRAEKGHLRFSTHYQRYGETNGTWHVDFWAKARSGSPQLRVTCDREEWGEDRALQVGREWEHHELVLRATGVPEPKGVEDNPMLFFRFEVTDGAILLDDVEIWMEDDTNPTVFRDDVVETLKRYKPGVVRYLQMGGSTLDNCLSPPLRSFTYASQNGAKVGPYESHNRDPYSLHEMYELCELLGSDPWYCLPGTLTQSEMKTFMEYLGAPPDVGYGKVRARLGHPRPWTQVFQHIHVEFGNEAWNNAGPYQCGGFNGKDYWRDLIETGKSSPYYRDNVLFHAGGQAVNTWLAARILKIAPDADRYAVAPYIIHNFTQAQARVLNTPDRLFRWAFAYPILRSTTEQGTMVRNRVLTDDAGMELSVYEVNHHITGGDGPLEPRNMLVTSIGGGLNVVNAMLLMLREQHARTQCLFSLAQHHYNARNVGPVRLWGTALNMRRGHERYRPTFLACALANKVIGGDLVETSLRGELPTFSASGVFEGSKEPRTVEDLPALWSYAFKDGKRMGLILINLDTTNAHPVKVAFDGQVVDGRAKTWRLVADRIEASNEDERPAPEVTVQAETLTSFASGSELTLPPFSMLGLRWTVR
ncbi:MAG: hypothetical protein ACE5O2_04170 [Armatimonadota bacterium]